MLNLGCSSAQSEVSYDEYGPLSQDEQVQVFQEITAENRRNLVRTQAERWLAVNGDSLSSGQIEAVEYVIDRIEPWMYEESSDAEDRESVLIDIMERLSAELSNEEIALCCGAGAPYIPPVE